MLMKYYWMDQDIETMSRERLVEVVVGLAKELETVRETSMSMNRTWATIAKSVARGAHR